MPRHEVIDEQRDVAPARAQRRHVQLDAAQAVVEIRPEASGLDERGETPVGRRHDADVNLPRVLPADALDGQILQHAQELGLRHR